MKTFVVDAFTDTRFKGNPAGVCLPDIELDEGLMLSIANELQFSETAFVRPLKKTGTFSIRFFSPKKEIPLCGHATLASASVILDIYNLEMSTFVNRDGVQLPVKNGKDGIVMLFPIFNLQKAQISNEMKEALGISQLSASFYNQETNILVIEIDSADQLKALSPNYAQLVASHSTIGGVLVMSKGNDGFDYFYRHFWPWNGTNEDPVTGAVQSFLGPYWSNKLNKKELIAFQPSERTGFMKVMLSPENVVITGTAVRVLEGSLLLD